MIDSNTYFEITPSLVINVTDDCTMHCTYCPPYGENLNKGYITYDNQIIECLINLAQKNKFNVLRITGGEPLMTPKRTKFCIEKAGTKFRRLILNTNGEMLDECFSWLDQYKKNIVLKISLDSITKNEYNELTNSFAYERVMSNIDKAIKKDYVIELNTVIVNQSIESILNTVDFADNNRFNIKLLTVSKFYGKVSQNTTTNLYKLIEYMDSKFSRSDNEKLIGNRGISMIKYNLKNSKLLLVDHNLGTSLTPTKTFFNDCNKCPLFPCDSGAFCITLSTDGILSSCRGQKSNHCYIFDKNDTQIEHIFLKQLSKFKKCFDININNY